MELSIITAKIISLIYIAAGIGVLIGSINFSSIVKELESSPALTLISGSLGIFIGVLLTSYHNLWVGDWRVLITIIGWTFLVGSIIVVALPKTLSSFAVQNSKIYGIFMVAFGGILGYFGFLS